MPKRTSRACDSCRKRKVKCDQRSPACTHCQASDIPCTYADPLRKRGPKPRSSPYSPQTPLDFNEDLSSRPGTHDSREHLPVASSDPYSAAVPSPNDTRSTIIFNAPTVDPGLSINLEEGSLAGLKHKWHAAVVNTFGQDSVQTFVRQCIGLYMERMFALIPILHESTLRSLGAAVATMVDEHSSRSTEMITVSEVREHSLVTSLCALACQAAPASSILRGKDLGPVLLAASHSSLRLHTDHDKISPTSTSLSTRIFLSAYHYLMGDAFLAWNYKNEAILLAQQMRLHDEQSYLILEPIEARLCKNVFCHLYSSDRSGFLLNNCPQLLDEFRLQEPVTTSFSSSLTIPLLDPQQPQNQGRSEALLMEGFQKDHEVWSLGYKVLFDLRLFIAANSRLGSDVKLDHLQQRSLTNSYLRFLTFLDDIPPYITNPSLIQSPNPEWTDFQRRGSWIQKVNITLTYHYLRIMILKYFIDLGYVSILGLSEDIGSLAWKKVEIAHDLLQLVTAVPFEALQSNGEACVEKLRVMCATLLEVMQQVEPGVTTERAQAHFTALLDVVSKLDSKVSDRLVSSYT